MVFLRRLVVFIIILVVILVGIGLFLPSTIKVQRSITIDAPKSFIFTRLNSFKTFNEWSPWAHIDPDTQFQYPGPDYGVGARIEWQSNNPNVGSGSQEIITSTPYSELEIALDFGPEGQANSTWTLSEAPQGTNVAWTLNMDFGNNILGKYIGLMMDGMVGKDFEKGLSSLKQNIEKLPHQEFNSLDIELINTQALTAVAIQVETHADGITMARDLSHAFAELMTFISAQNIQLTGMPIAITRKWNPDSGWIFDAALPVSPETTITGDTHFTLIRTYAGKAVRAIQVGPYSDAEKTYPLIFSYMAAMGLKQSDDSWEAYINNPATVDESEILTEIYFPVK